MAESTCTLGELRSIITGPSGGLTMLPDDAVDEVYPGLYIGEESIARNLEQLSEMEITHIVNASRGTKDKWHCNISPIYYKKLELVVMGVEATDAPQCQIHPHFERAASFIDGALESGGKVLVHCREGVSRSATIVLAFLMLKRNMTVQEALRKVRHGREICPNDGFLQQLCDLNDKLSAEGHFTVAERL